MVIFSHNLEILSLSQLSEVSEVAPRDLEDRLLGEFVLVLNVMFQIL